MIGMCTDERLDEMLSKIKDLQKELKEVEGRIKKQYKKRYSSLGFVDDVNLQIPSKDDINEEDAKRDKPDYESWNREELYDLAKTLDIDGRSKMNKKQLINALRKRN